MQFTVSIEQGQQSRHRSGVTKLPPSNQAHARAGLLYLKRGEDLTHFVNRTTHEREIFGLTFGFSCSATLHGVVRPGLEKPKLPKLCNLPAVIVCQLVLNETLNLVFEHHDSATARSTHLRPDPGAQPSVETGLGSAWAEQAPQCQPSEGRSLLPAR